MDPYIVMIIGMLLIFGVGSLLVYRIYKNRTHTPEVDVNGIVKSALPSLPDGVDTEDISSTLGSVFK